MIGTYIYNSEVDFVAVVEWFRSKNVEIASLTVEDHKAWNKIIGGTSLVTTSLFDSLKKYREKKIDCFVVNTCASIDSSFGDYLELIRNGVSEDDIYFIPIEVYYRSETDAELMTFKTLPYVQHLEFHTTHKCNLNCGGCNHFVPLMEKSCEIDYERMIKDLKHFKQIAHHVSDISIVGGEPLVSDHLLDYCREVRNLWPYSIAEIYTNGLLIKKVDPVMLAEITALNIVLRISAYPGYGINYEELIEYCEAKNLLFSYEYKYGMYPPLHQSTEMRFPAKNTEMCKWLTVEEGRLYPCPMMTYVKHFNKHFGKNYPEEQGLDLYDENLTAYDINQWCGKIHHLCNFCNEYPERGRNSEWLTNPMIIYGNDIKPKEEWWVSDLK